MTKPIYFLRYFAAEKRTNVNLVIDIGNTVAKLAVFDGDEVAKLAYWLTVAILWR